MYACAFLEFLKGVSHRVSVFHEARPSLSSTPIFAQKSRVCYTAKVVRRRNGTLRVEGCRIWPMPATWVTGEPAWNCPESAAPSSCIRLLSLSLSLSRVNSCAPLETSCWPLHKYNASYRLLLSIGKIYLFHEIRKIASLRQSNYHTCLIHRIFCWKRNCNVTCLKNIYF